VTGTRTAVDTNIIIDFLNGDAHTINSSSDIEYRYARIKTELKRRGRPIPENDIWIAACAQSAESPLFSRDDHFTEIENLSLVGL